MLCKICNINPAPRPDYHGLCTKCRVQKYEHSRGKTCSDCGKPVNNKATRCIPCANKLRRNREIRNCEFCGKSFECTPSDCTKYCSRDCRKKGVYAFHKKYGVRRKATETITKTGYVDGWDESRKDRTRVHITKAERALGRRLKVGEIVHHINLNKSDNRNCNLLICTQSYHRWLHHYMAVVWVKEHPELRG